MGKLGRARKATKAPAFQFYAAEYLADENVALMTLEEEGAYIRALAFCWREGSIPADLTLLSRLLKHASLDVVRTVVRRFEQIETPIGTRLVHARLELERQKQKNWMRKSADAGVKSGQVRRAKKLQAEPTFANGSQKNEPNHEPNTNSSFASSSLNKKQKHSDPLPDWLDPKLWASWVEMRRKIPRAPFTEDARKGILSDLAKLHEWGIDVTERLEKGIKAGWRGVLFDSDKPAPAAPKLIWEKVN